MSLYQTNGPAWAVAAAVALLLASPVGGAAQPLPPSCSDFTDNPLVAGQTRIQAAHLEQLRACVNALRTQRGLAAASWTDPVITQGQTRVKAVHVTELRTALVATYIYVGRPAPDLGAALTPTVTVIRASHFMALRAAAVALEAPCSYQLSPTAAPAATWSGDSGSFTVATAVGCTWEPMSQASWIHVVSGASGNGSATVAYTVDWNTTSSPRASSIAVAGHSFSLQQEGQPPPPPPPGQTNCNEACTPTRFNYSSFSGHYKVCFQPLAFTAGELAGMTNGIELYWGWMFQQHGINISFSYDDSIGQTGCDITVFVDSNVPAQNPSYLALAYHGQQNGRGSHIGINPVITGGIHLDTLWQNLAAHEMGHLLDWDDVHTANCQTQTIMFAYTGNGPLPDILCVDHKILRDRYGTTFHPPVNIDVADPVDSHCFAVYQATDYYYFHDGWHFWGTAYEYLYTYCVL